MTVPETMRREVESSLIDLRTEAGGCCARFRFDPALATFAGHFPGDPIVPGVHLIEAARIAAERDRSRRFVLRAVEQARFSAEVRPDDLLEVGVRYVGSGASLRLDAELRNGDTEAARFRLHLADSTDS